MVQSSFSPAPGAELKDQLRRLSPHRRHLSAIAPPRGARLGFSQYVSSRTVLAGGCLAVNHEVVAGLDHRSASKPF